MGSGGVVAALVCDVISTRSIPERIEGLTWVSAALHGVNQLGHLGEAVAEAQRKNTPESPPAPQPWPRRISFVAIPYSASIAR